MNIIVSFGFCMLIGAMPNIVWGYTATDFEWWVILTPFLVIGFKSGAINFRNNK